MHSDLAYGNQQTIIILELSTESEAVWYYLELYSSALRAYSSKESLRHPWLCL